MRVLIADFEIAKYGGIIEHVTAKAKALRELGHVVDVAQLSSSSVSQSFYDKKIREFESGEFDKKLKLNSQNGGYEFDETLGYWKNNYYGFFLPPSRRIGVFEKDALERWYNLVENFDLIMWNFMPTKSRDWIKDGKKFDFWWRFYDLPTDRIKQIFIVHDAYFDVRASNVTALKDKILFLECAHIAAYSCCQSIGIPRKLLLNPRYFDSGDRMPIRMMQNRKTDFFAAHIFKSMKKVDDLIRAIPHLRSGRSVKIAGSGIEQAYMVAPTKCKEPYKVSRKRDPDIDEKYIGEKIWDVGEKFGMEYLGQISGEEVRENLLNAKFAVDPSWASHYANYCRTHVNGFIIEAMIAGCYPIMRDYRGLVEQEVEDPLFDNIRAIFIPWNATPKEFADAMEGAMKITPLQYLKDTKYNYQLVRTLFNAVDNMREVLKLVEGGEKKVRKELKCGRDSENVKKITKEIMTDFFGIELPIEWETD